MTEYRIAVDTGGTFTDCVIIDDQGTVSVGKALSTAGRLADGVIDSIRVAAGAFGTLSEVLERTIRLAHGTTAVLNTILTRSGSRVGILTTEGFEDTLRIGRVHQKVAGLSESEIADAFSLKKTELFRERSLTRGVQERVDVAGNVLRPIDRDQVLRVARQLVDAGAESFAVGLLWSFRFPEHELIVADVLKQQFPDHAVSLSHEVAPRLGEYERLATTALEAYVRKATGDYLSRLRHALADEGYRGEVLVMQSSGGLARLLREVSRPLGLVFSGPVGGLVASERLRPSKAHDVLLCADVGGTSFDVGILEGGAPRWAQAPIIAGFHTLVPTMELESIGMGGGSVAWIEPQFGLLHVGPQSAGAEPGPACYGRGGTAPTVTDAALALGWIPDRTFRSAGLRLQSDLARAAIENEIARPMNLSTIDAARAILRIATSKMGDLVRKATIERGVDPRGATLVSYGGAGGQYAAAVCEEVGISTFVVPLLASALSAFGMLFADEVMFAEQSLHRKLPIEPQWLVERLSEIEERLVSDLTSEGSGHSGVSAEWFVDMRFAQQINELRVQISKQEIEAGRLHDVFSARYETRYGRGTAYAPAGIELIGLAVRVRRATHRSTDTNLRMATSAAFDLDPVEVTFLDGRTVNAEMHSLTRLVVGGGEVSGPAIIVGPGTAVVVPEHAVARPLGSEAIEVSLGGAS